MKSPLISIVLITVLLTATSTFGQQQTIRLFMVFGR